MRNLSCVCTMVMAGFLVAACSDKDGDGPALDAGGNADAASGSDGGPPRSDAGGTPDTAPPRADGGVDAVVVGPVPSNGCFTPCLKKWVEVLTSCPNVGACVVSPSAGSALSFNVCYANGVKQSLGAELRTYKAGGGLCYSATVERSSSTFKDGDGRTLGVLTENEKEESLFTCEGTTINLSSCGGDMVPGGMAPDDDDVPCSEGVCSVP